MCNQPNVTYTHFKDIVLYFLVIALLQIAALVTNPFDVVKTLYQIEFTDKQIMTGEYQT